MLPATVERAIMDSGPRTLFYDAFQRANSSSGFGTAPTGQTWGAVTGVVGISSDLGVPVTYVGNLAIARVALTSAQTRSLFVVNFGTTTTGKALCPIVRYSDVNNYWFFQIANTSIAIREVAAGVVTTRAVLAVALVANTDYQVQVFCVGTTIIGRIEGVGQVSYGAMASGLTNVGLAFRFANSGAISGEHCSKITAWSL